MSTPASAPSEMAFFSLLARAGSFSAAARELDVTTPAVSKRLALMEARLGVPLNTVNPARLLLGVDQRVGDWKLGAVIAHTMKKSASDMGRPSSTFFSELIDGLTRFCSIREMVPLVTPARLASSR